MSTIHYFARYSQRENFVTNNTLLLLSRIHERHPFLLKGLLAEIFADANTQPEVGVAFEQQVSIGRNSRKPDGSISQSGFRLLIETKLHGQFDMGQILGHCKHFRHHEHKYLLLLDTEAIDLSAIQRKVGQEAFADVVVSGITFESLVGIIRLAKETIAPHDFELDAIIDDYVDFCIETKIMSVEKYLLRLRTSGDTLLINHKYNTYYELRNRNNRRYTYFGLYADKVVKAVGKVKNIVEAEYVDGKLIVGDSLKEVDAHDKQCIVGIMKASMLGVKDDWSPYHDHRFIIVEKFYDTDFRMKITSPHSALRFDKYIDLRDYFSGLPLPKTEQIAEGLKLKEW